MTQLGGGGQPAALAPFPAEANGIALEQAGARLLNLLGPHRLGTVLDVMDGLGELPSLNSAGTPVQVHRILAARAPELARNILLRDLVDPQGQDLPLALLFLTHPALPAHSSPLLLLRLLRGWSTGQLEARLGWPAGKVDVRLRAGFRRIQTLRLTLDWPRRRDLVSRAEHSLEVITGLPQIVRRRLPPRQVRNHLLRLSLRFTEALCTHPNVSGRGIDFHRWRARFRAGEATQGLESRPHVA